MLHNLSITTTIILLFTLTANANEFYQKKSEGWFWYEDKKKESENKEQQNANLTPSERLQALRKEAEDKLNTAIDKPTEENVKNYMQVQKQIVEKSNVFSEIWRRILYTHPELDESVKNPTAQFGAHLFYDLENKKKKEAITKIAKEYGLFYFYKNNCPYCQQFSPVVAAFSKKYDFSLLPITMDGVVNSEFPNSKLDNGISETLNITQVPALIAVHPATNKIIPLAHGLMCLDEIEERAYFLTKQEVKDD
jgi:conjugal transfer pilus assembly protein TraF